ncbi:S-type pyocin domain-containing protein [Citrobacter freundii]
MMTDNQPVPLTPAPPGMVSLGVNADGEEEMTVIGGDGGTGFSGGTTNIVPGSGSMQADAGNKTLSRIQAENSAAIHNAAKWSTEQLKNTQRAQAAQVNATIAAQQKAKVSRDNLTQHLKDIVNNALQNNSKGPSVTDLAHANNAEMAAAAARQGAARAEEEARKKAEKAEKEYQAALRAQEEAQRQQAEVDRKLKEAQEREAAAKAKADADKAAADKADAEAREQAEKARKALFAKAGILDTPVYTPEMVKAATTLMMTPGVAFLSRGPGMIQLSAGVAQIDAALPRMTSAVMSATAEFSGWISSALWRGVVGVAETATATTVGPMVAAASTLFFSPRAGGGDDSKVPGRDIAMMAAQVSLFNTRKVNVEPGVKSVDLPVRGFITTDEDGNQSVILVKTGTGGVSATVPVLNAVRDSASGLDKITVPAMAGAPSRTILVNPVPVGPAAPSHTGNSAPVPVMPVHTGTEVKQADSIVTTTFPAADLPLLQDFIYWQPDATGSGVEAIYVILAKPPVEFLEVELYNDFRGRSRQRTYEADHMPSAAAVRAALLRENPRLSKQLLDEMVNNVAAIVVPKDVHQKLSETYGGRNTPTQIDLDSKNLRAALDRNLDTIKPALKKYGATETQIDAARAKMHKLNKDMGLYK